MKKVPPKPEDIISQAGLSPDDLGDEGKEALKIYFEFEKMSQKHQDQKEFRQKALQGMEESAFRIQIIVEQVLESRKSKEEKEQEKEQKKQEKKEKSVSALRIVKSEVEPDLESCRERLREYRKQQKANQAPKPKKTRITKLKERLLAIARLIPEKMRKDDEVLDKTEKVLLETLHDLSDLWGMTRIHPAEKAIDEKFNHLEEKAES